MLVVNLWKQLILQLKYNELFINIISSFVVLSTIKNKSLIKTLIWNSFSQILAEVKKVRRHSSDPFWIGIVNPSNDYTPGNHGNWTFLDGEPVEDLIFDWHPDEPDNRYGNEKCARVWNGKNQLYDFQCGYLSLVLCQVPTVCWKMYLNFL